MRKVAVVTEDGERVSNHFGRAPWYKVFVVDENGQVVSSEMREKWHHAADHQHNHQADHSHHGPPTDLFAPVLDCEAVIVGGAGAGALQRAEAAGVTLLLAGGRVDDVVSAWARGALISDPRRVHRHHH